jgi:hypothetical protein
MLRKTSAGVGKPRRLHPADHVGQLPPETIECLPDLIVIETELLSIVIETELLSATGALESLVAANPFKRSSGLTTAVRAANDLHNVAKGKSDTVREVSYRWCEQRRRHGEPLRDEKPTPIQQPMCSGEEISTHSRSHSPGDSV